MPTSSTEEAAFLDQMGGVLALPASERVQAFLPMNLAPGHTCTSATRHDATLDAHPRPDGISALVLSARQARIEPARLAAFTRPVYVVYGNLSHPAWRTMSQTLSRASTRLHGRSVRGPAPPQPTAARSARALRRRPARAVVRAGFRPNPVSGICGPSGYLLCRLWYGLWARGGRGPTGTSRLITPQPKKA